MDSDAAVKFINSIVKNLQLLCHSNINFSENIEIIGHLYLNVDSGNKYNYFVNEKVCRNNESSTVFVSNSFHAQPVASNANGKFTPDTDTVNQSQKALKGHEKNFNSEIVDERELLPRKPQRHKENTTCTIPLKIPRLDLDLSKQGTNVGVGEKTQEIASFSQFNIMASLKSKSSNSVKTNRKFDCVKEENSSLSCIDLTTIKSEPIDDDEDDDEDDDQSLLLSEYNKNQGSIYGADEESLSDFSGTNDQLMMNMYSESLNQQNSSYNKLSMLSSPLLSSPSSLFYPSTSKQIHGSSPPSSSLPIAKEESSYGKTRYQCPLCEKNFSFKTNVQRHIKERHFPTKFKCTFCAKNFSRPGNLNDHMLQCHSTYMSTSNISHTEEEGEDEYDDDEQNITSPKKMNSILSLFSKHS